MGVAGRESDIGIIPTGSGPIFLSSLNCDGIDNDILECSSQSITGTSSCTHQADAIVHCEGNKYIVSLSSDCSVHTIVHDYIIKEQLLLMSYIYYLCKADVKKCLKLVQDIYIGLAFSHKY